MFQLHQRLAAEFQARRAKNPRYSLRAFARFLRTDHSTLSQILRGTRPAPARSIRSWCAKLGLTREEAAAYIAAGQLPPPETTQRQAQLQHWTAEALAIVSEPLHWDILRLCSQPGFRADSRWIARQTGAGVDAVNLAVQRLLRLRLMAACGPNEWKSLRSLRRATEREFRKVALTKVREEAAKS